MTSSSTGVVVVGASQAGVQVAVSLREQGHRDPITLVDAEPHLPYQRPPLSKAFMKGAVGHEHLLFPNAGFYAQHGISLRLGEVVVDATRDSGGVRLRFTNGDILRADRLVLATGASPRRLSVAGADAHGVHYLRGLEDALAITSAIRGSADVLVVGGGFIGLEAAATARLLGKRVTVVEGGPRLLGRAVCHATAEHVAEQHRRDGVDLRIGVMPLRFTADRDGHVQEAVLSDGTTVAASTVIVGIGVTPRTEVAEALGLACSNGVVVDEYCRASDGETIAIGDCANLPDPSPDAVPGSRLRLESVDNAVEQAKVASRTLVGDLVPYRSVPWFWSDQGATKIQIAGLSHAHDQTVVRALPEKGRFAVAYFKDDQLIAFDAINWPADFLAARKHLERRTKISPHDVVDPDVPMKALLPTAAPQ